MAKNRLFVDEIVSIGLVESADNPGAEVMIYKAKTPEPWSLAESNRQLEETKKEREHRQQVDQIEARRGKEPRRMSMSEAIDKHYHGEETGTLTEKIAKDLQTWAGSNARQRHISPRHGDLQKTRAQIVILEKAEFWESSEGKALTALDRDYGSAQASEVLGKIQKSGEHAAGFAALASLSQ